VKFQININMAVAGTFYSEKWFKGRFDSIVNLIEANHDWELVDYTRVDQQNESDTVNGLVLQSVFVAEIDTCGYMQPTDRMVKFIHALSTVLLQGCIAVYEPHVQGGYLVGTNTKPWGAFDINKFITIEEARA